MKFLHFSLLFVSLVLTSPAQAQTIPDANFAAAIAAACPTCISGNVLQPPAKALPSLVISSSNISDLTGINGFTALTTLNCSHNELTSLPPLPSSLTALDCGDNKLKSLPELPKFLTSLECGSNQLTSLPPLPTSLTKLGCGYNKLTSLPSPLPSSLDELFCNENQLASLPPLPKSMTYLECTNNQLKSLPPLPASLITFGCATNQLTNLPTPLPSSLEELYCINNKLTNLPTLPASLKVLGMDASITCIPNQVAGLKITDKDNKVITRPACPLPTSGKTFKGTSDFVSLPNTISKGLSGGSAVTIEYWFKGTNIQSAVRLQSDNSSFIVAGWGSNDPQHIISTDGSTNGVKIKTGTGANLYDNKWHHVAMTWEKGKINGFKSYVDGVLVHIRNAANVDLPDLTGVTPVLGAFINGSARSEFTNGQLARIRIWKVARTEAQIKESKDKVTDYLATENGLLYQGTPQ